MLNYIRSRVSRGEIVTVVIIAVALLALLVPAIRVITAAGTAKASTAAERQVSSDSFRFPWSGVTTRGRSVGRS